MKRFWSFLIFGLTLFLLVNCNNPSSSDELLSEDSPEAEEPQENENLFFRFTQSCSAGTIGQESQLGFETNISDLSMLNWEILDSSLCAISGDGVITGLELGSTIITVGSIETEINESIYVDIIEDMALKVYALIGDPYELMGSNDGINYNSILTATNGGDISTDEVYPYYKINSVNNSMPEIDSVSIKNKGFLYTTGPYWISTYSGLDMDIIGAPNDRYVLIKDSLSFGTEHLPLDYPEIYPKFDEIVRSNGYDIYFSTETRDTEPYISGSSLTADGNSFTYTGRFSGDLDIDIPTDVKSILIKNIESVPSLIDSLSLLDDAGDYYYFPNGESGTISFGYNMEGDPDGKPATLGMREDGFHTSKTLHFDVRTASYPNTETLRLYCLSSASWADILPPDNICRLGTYYYETDRSGGRVVSKKYGSWNYLHRKYTYNYDGFGQVLSYDIYDGSDTFLGTNLF